MIAWNKQNICDACKITSMNDAQIQTYTITITSGAIKKQIILCEGCLKELIQKAEEILQQP